MISLDTAKKLKLRNGGETIVDPEVYEWCKQFKWYRSPKGYVYRHIWLDGGRRTTVRLHREITDCPKGLLVDHINGNPLDNQRSNLRLCTPVQNSINRYVRQGQTSKYKGVNWDKLHKKWKTTIGVSGKGKFLGYFSLEDDAAKAYDAAAIAYYGEFANINFPETRCDNANC